MVLNEVLRKQESAMKQTLVTMFMSQETHCLVPIKPFTNHRKPGT